MSQYPYGEQSAPQPQQQYAYAPPPPEPKRKRRWPWYAVGAVVLVSIGSALGGGGGDEPPAAVEPTTVEQTTEPEPTTEPATEEATTEEPEPDPTTEPVAVEEPTEDVWDSTDYDTTMLVIEMTWESTDAEAQADICWGVNNIGMDWAIETISDGAEQEFNEDALRDFFERVC